MSSNVPDHAPVSLLDELNEALRVGAFFNPEQFGAMLKRGDNPILRWRDAVAEQAATITRLTEDRSRLRTALQNLVAHISWHGRLMEQSLEPELEAARTLLAETGDPR